MLRTKAKPGRTVSAACAIIFAVQKSKEFKYSARVVPKHAAVFAAQRQGLETAVAVADLQRPPWLLSKSRPCEATAGMWPQSSTPARD
jgi:hypothetical protein